MNKNIQILVIGAGSIGERHIRNLWNLGYKNISVFRQRNLPFRDITDAKVNVLLDWQDIIKQKFEIAFICTPTSQHIEQVILCVNENMHVFVEKPLSHTLEKFEELEQTLLEKEIYLHTGYMLHFHPFLKQVKKWVEGENFGRLKNFETTWQSYLPDWHPWEDHKTSYAARPEMGGGAALTLCHDVEFMQWMCGEVKEHDSKFHYCKELGLEVNTGADITLQFESAKGVCHVDFCSKEEKRTYHFSFQKAEIEIDYLKSEMKIYQGNIVEIKNLPEFERNEMYVKQMQDFFINLSEKNFSPDTNIKSLQKEKRLVTICNPDLASRPVEKMKV